MDLSGAKSGELRETEGCKRDAVETHEARICPQPDIAILGLGDRIDAVGRETVLLQPRLAIILVNVLAGIQSEAADGDQKKKRQRSHQQQATRPLAHYRKSFQLKTTELSA